MAVQIQIRRDTAANWTSNNPTLAQGELAFETDTRLAKMGDGTTPWNSLAYWPTGSGNAIEFEPQFQESSPLYGVTPAQFPNIFPQRWKTYQRRNLNWDQYLKYLFWAFFCPESNSLLPAARYATLADMATALQSIVPMSGGAYQGTVLLWTYDAYDPQDPYPMERHCRNSLVATMQGSRRWLRRQPSHRYGVSGNFNAPAYYMNFYGRLGIEFVTAYNNQVPPTNNDGVVWYSNAKRGGLWKYPKVGSYLTLPSIGGPYRPAVWDTVAQAWVTPAPGGSYVIQPPFYLHEPRRGAMLRIDRMVSGSDIYFPIQGVAAAVHPLVQGNYVAFLVTPSGFDCWWTDPVGTGYEHTVKLRYRNEVSDRMLVLSPYLWDGEREMYHHFLSGVRSYFFPENNASMHLDSDLLPTKVMIARRNQTTGVRSPWVKIGRLDRRLINAPLRFQPDYRQ
jgi:hypothetical protein